MKAPNCRVSTMEELTRSKGKSKNKSIKISLISSISLLTFLNPPDPKWSSNFRMMAKGKNLFQFKDSSLLTKRGWLSADKSQSPKSGAVPLLVQKKRVVQSEKKVCLMIQLTFPLTLSL